MGRRWDDGEREGGSRASPARALTREPTPGQTPNQAPGTAGAHGLCLLLTGLVCPGNPSRVAQSVPARRQAPWSACARGWAGYPSGRSTRFAGRAGARSGRGRRWVCRGKQRQAAPPWQEGPTPVRSGRDRVCPKTAARSTRSALCSTPVRDSPGHAPSAGPRPPIRNHAPPRNPRPTIKPRQPACPRPAWPGLHLPACPARCRPLSRDLRAHKGSPEGAVAFALSFRRRRLSSWGSAGRCPGGSAMAPSGPPVASPLPPTEHH